MATPTSSAPGQAEATRLAHKDEQAKRREAPKSNPAHDTSELPEPDVDDDAPQGEKLEAIEASVSLETEARIDRELHRVEDTGVVAPRSVIAPAKPAREPNEDEQRMAEDFDPPPLAHRTELGR